MHQALDLDRLIGVTHMPRCTLQGRIWQLPILWLYLCGAQGDVRSHLIFGCFRWWHRIAITCQFFLQKISTDSWHDSSGLVVSCLTTWHEHDIDFDISTYFYHIFWCFCTQLPTTPDLTEELLRLLQDVLPQLSRDPLFRPNPLSPQWSRGRKTTKRSAPETWEIGKQ